MKIDIENTHDITIACHANNTFYHVRNNICKGCLVRTKCLKIKDYTYGSVAGTIFTEKPCDKIVSDYRKFNENIRKHTTLIWTESN